MVKNLIQFLLSMGPNYKGVINVSPEHQWFQRGTFQGKMCKMFRMFRIDLVDSLLGFFLHTSYLLCASNSTPQVERWLSNILEVREKRSTLQTQFVGFAQLSCFPILQSQRLTAALPLNSPPPPRPLTMVGDGMLYLPHLCISSCLVQKNNLAWISGIQERSKPLLTVQPGHGPLGDCKTPSTRRISPWAVSSLSAPSRLQARMTLRGTQREMLQVSLWSQTIRALQERRVCFQRAAASDCT